MRFLADENIPGVAVKALIAGGHDVIWVRTVASGASDKDVLILAARERRILLTFDKDFGELSTRSPDFVEGVVLFRTPLPKPNAGESLARLISKRDDWSGHFSVVSAGRIRMRKLKR